MSPTQEKFIARPDPELEDIVPGYLDNRHKEIPVLRDALAQEDFDALRIFGHRMKGTGAGYGFDLISDIGREMEIAARASNGARIAEEIERLVDYLARVEVIYADE
ncbi:Hpt domain-containing protein [Magnetococcales bacterium HHB-1]